MRDHSDFIDYYEILQLNPGADSETLERVYRLLAKRYHPDNQASGDETAFRLVHQAYEILSNPERRAAFDVQYDRQKRNAWQIFDQATALDAQRQDQRIFFGILSLLYAARRRNPESGGLGSLRLEEYLGVPREHLGFPLWYLRQRRMVEYLPSGELAITVDGIDTLNKGDLTLPDDRLLNRGAMDSGEGPAQESPSPSIA